MSALQSLPRYEVLSRHEGDPCVGCHREATKIVRLQHGTITVICNDCAEEHGAVSGWVYFVRAGRYVKIGYAKDVEGRIRSLATGNPHELELVLKVPGSYSLEKDFHAEFAGQRIRAEWFAYDGDLRAYLEARA